MAVFCVQFVTDQPYRPGQVVWSVRASGMDRPAHTKSHPAVSLSSSLPGGLPCWASPLAFGLIGRVSLWMCRGWGSCSTPLTLPHSISQLIVVVILQRRPCIGFQFRPCTEYSTTGGCLGTYTGVICSSLWVFGSIQYTLLLLTQFVLRGSHPAESEVNSRRYHTVPQALQIQRWNLDIIWQKDSSLFLHVIHSPFYWRILKKTILCSGFKNT